MADAFRFQIARRLAIDAHQHFVTDEFDAELMPSGGVELEGKPRVQGLEAVPCCLLLVAAQILVDRPLTLLVIHHPERVVGKRKRGRFDRHGGDSADMRALVVLFLHLVWQTVDAHTSSHVSGARPPERPQPKPKLPQRRRVGVCFALVRAGSWTIELRSNEPHGRRRSPMAPLNFRP